MCSFSAALAVCPVSPKFQIPWSDFVQRQVFSARFFCSALCHPRACAAVSDSHSDQLLRTLHSTNPFLHYMPIFCSLQSAQSVPSSRFLAQTLFRGIIQRTKTSGDALPLGALGPRVTLGRTRKRRQSTGRSGRSGHPHRTKRSGTLATVRTTNESMYNEHICTHLQVG